MQKLFFLSTLIILSVNACSKQNEAIATLKTAYFELEMNSSGNVIGLVDSATGNNYVAQDSLSPLFSVRIQNEIKMPQSVQIKKDTLLFGFEEGIEAKLKFEEKESYLVLELVSLTQSEKVDLIIWGPYRNTISKIIGETVGVVRGEEFAIGIQSLNLKTLGGYPWNESDRMPAFDIFKENDPNNMHPESDGGVLYRVEAAKPTATGSSLQAYCRNRNKRRLIADFDHEKILAPTHQDGGVLHSKIALFGVPTAKALETLGKIELEENLPHPLLDGQWVKTAEKANAAYIITSFTEETIDQAIALTQKAGLNYLYHYGKTFESWGHFDLFKGEFPNGRQGLKACVDKAAAAGIKLGTHFLSNFITTNDPYVTPVPDKRLAKVGFSTLSKAITKNDTEIEIASPAFFNQMKNNTLQTVMLGEELIQYGGVSTQAPWKLLDCQRGAFNTRATNHIKGDSIAKLLDHPYKVFLTNADLTVEVSNRMAALYNETGLRQISFDGLEGNRSTGLGTYGESLMPYTWYSALTEELKSHLIIDASRTTHFFWHIYTRMNWGEPWYEDFRESQTAYRFNNQAYFKRNFMPGMLGWFLLTLETSIEDIEWLLSKSAGYEAGYALVAEQKVVDKNGHSDSLLTLIGDWEKLRLANVFSETQKEMMRDTEKEFSLKRIEENQWTLTENHSDIFYHNFKVRQPGEPLSTPFEFDNPAEQQNGGFLLTALNADVENIELELNKIKKIKLPTPLKKGQKLKYSPGDKLRLFDAQWKELRAFEWGVNAFRLKHGKNSISVEGEFINRQEEARLRLEVRAASEETVITLKEE